MDQSRNASESPPYSERKIGGSLEGISPSGRSSRHLGQVTWIHTLKKMYKYFEIQGGDHGNVLAAGMPHIFAFFKERSKPASQ